MGLMTDQIQKKRKIVNQMTDPKKYLLEKQNPKLGTFSVMSSRCGFLSFYPYGLDSQCLLNPQLNIFRCFGKSQPYVSTDMQEGMKINENSEHVSNMKKSKFKMRE